MKVMAGVEIRRSPRKVLDYLCNTDNAINWRTRFVESGITSAGRIKEGSTSFTKLALGKHQMTTYWELISYQKGSFAKWKITSGLFIGTNLYKCDHSEFGTFLTIETDVRLKLPFGFLVSPLIWLVILYNNRKDVLKLKQLLEN